MAKTKTKKSKSGKKFTKTQMQTTIKDAVKKYKNQSGSKKFATFIKEEFAKKRKQLGIKKK